MAERIKTDRLDANLLFLVQEWNEEYLERSISWNHLKRIRDDIPLISTQEEFWDSVSSEVERILPQVTSQKTQPKS